MKLCRDVLLSLDGVNLLVDSLGRWLRRLVGGVLEGIEDEGGGSGAVRGASRYEAEESGRTISSGSRKGSKKKSTGAVTG